MAIVFFRSLLITLVSFTTGMAAAISAVPDVLIDAKLQMKTDHRPVVDGEIMLSNWTTPSNRYCVYLPYNDTHYSLDPLRDEDLIPRKMADLKPIPGSIVLSPMENVKVVPISHHVYEIFFDKVAQLKFSTTLPSWPDAPTDEFVFADFYPQPLAACPNSGDDIADVALQPLTNVHLNLQSPKEWLVVSPGVSSGEVDRPTLNGVLNQFDISAKKLAFALVQNWRTNRLVVQGIDVEWVSRTGEFERFVPILSHAIETSVNIFGLYPFRKLVVMTTSDLQKSAVPGLLMINSPKVEGLAQIQESASYWSEWQLAVFVAEQWYGTAKIPSSYDDLWLIRGLMEFCAFETLRTFGRGFSLLKYPSSISDETYAKKLNINYRQIQDLQTTYLNFVQPFHTLTDENFKTKSTFRQQFGMNFIRAAIGFRQLSAMLGPDKFARLLKSYGVFSKGEFVTPQHFAKFITETSSEVSLDEKEQLKESLKIWWTHDTWPDFKLDTVHKSKRSDGRWDVEVEINQPIGLEFPVPVEVIDEGDHSYLAEAIKIRPGNWRAVFVTNEAPRKVFLDPARKYFDWNRFDNRSGLMEMQFLPGDLRTFDDDKYSTVWLPLASKLPGEPLTWLLISSTFKYVHSNITFIGGYAPKTEQKGFSLLYFENLPRFGGYTIFNLIQNRGLTYAGERLLDGSLFKKQDLGPNQEVEIGVRVRNRETMNDVNHTRHQTAALKLKFVPVKSTSRCRYAMAPEVERVIQSSTVAQQYDRRLANLDLNCKFIDRVSLDFHAFAGQLTGGAGVSKRVHFNPQEATEARLRIDQPQLEKVDKIATFGADILMPLPLPLPSSLLAVNRQIRLRGFSDVGTSWGPNIKYKDAGVGLWIPFGGDVVGKGSVQVLNLSVLAVLYRSVGDFESRKLGVVFDFSFMNR